MMIRKATLDDLKDIANLESECFPASEAATINDFEERLKVYPNHFLLLFLDDKLVSFVDGFCTNDADLTDEMYENAILHDEDGDWQMIFGLNTHPDYRKRGFASRLINCMIKQAQREKRLGVVLTCKNPLIDYYSKFGFVDEGISESVHGGEVWNQMRLTFKGVWGCKNIIHPLGFFFNRYYKIVLLYICWSFLIVCVGFQAIQFFYILD